MDWMQFSAFENGCTDSVVFVTHPHCALLPLPDADSKHEHVAGEAVYRVYGLAQLTRGNAIQGCIIRLMSRRDSSHMGAM